MLTVTKDWNPKQKLLTQLLSSKDKFIEGILLCKQMHHEIHDLIKGERLTLFQSLITGLSNNMITYRPDNNHSSIAWNVWHITRIEDAVINILINNSDQIFNKEWMKKINTNITDTGNALKKNDVDQFSNTINFKELLNYRNSVGKNTQKVLQILKESDKKRKPNETQLERLVLEKVLTEEEESIWLKEFWGNKTINGLLLMPITRHQIIHINDCYKLKEKYIKKFG